MAGILLIGAAVYPLLPVAPLPEVDFPTIQVSAQLPGASPETMASSVATPLEEQFAQIPGRHPDDLDERARQLGDHRAVRSQPQHRCGGAGHPGGDQRRRRTAAQEPADPADLSQGQPGRSADPDLRRPFRRHAADHGRRLRREHPGPADLADQRRRADRRRRPAEAGGAHSGRSGQARGARDRPRGRRHRHLERDRRHADRKHRRTDAQLHDLRQRPAPRRRSMERHHHRLQERRAGADPRCRPGGRRAGERQARGLGRNAAHDPAAGVQAAGRQRDRHGGADQGGAAAPAGRHSADRQGRHPDRPHDDDPRVGPRRAVHADADDRPRRAGDLRVSAQPVGDDHPQRHRAARPRRHLRRHVRDRLQPRQSVADGPHHRRRLRRRRRHRHDRERLPPHGRRLEPDGGGAQGLGRDRLHHHLDQPVADRRVHPAPAHGRHHRPPVPRVRHDGDDDHRHLGDRLADADADDVLALSAQRARETPRAALHADRARLRPHAGGLSLGARRGAAASVPDAARLPRDGGGDRLSLRRHSQGILSPAGHRPHHRRL